MYYVILHLFFSVGQKETIERFGMNSPYFIHGYVVPRMFGYAEEDDDVSLVVFLVMEIFSNNKKISKVNVFKLAKSLR